MRDAVVTSDGEEYDELDAAIDGAMDVVARLRGEVITHNTMERRDEVVPESELGPLPPPETRALGNLFLWLAIFLAGLGVGGYFF